MPLDPIAFAAIGYGIVLLAGIVAGVRQRVIVFADLSDLLTTFAIVAGTVLAGFFVLMQKGLAPQATAWIIATLGSISIGAIGWRAWRANRTVVSTVLAVLTKLPFAIGVPLLAIQLAAPTGNTAGQRASNRAVALLLLTVVAPVLFALVRDRRGVERYLGVT